MRSLLNAFLACAFIWLLPFVVAIIQTGDASNPAEDPSDKQRTLQNEQFDEQFTREVRWDLFKTQREAFRTILTNNTRVAVTNGSGAFTFGITTVASLSINGLATGHLIKRHIVHGMSVHTVLAYTLPHSIELIGVWLAGAVGLRGATVVFSLVRGRAQDQSAQTLMILISAFLLSLGIILIAAWLEAYVTMDTLF